MCSILKHCKFVLGMKHSSGIDSRLNYLYDVYDIKRMDDYDIKRHEHTFTLAAELYRLPIVIGQMNRLTSNVSPSLLSMNLVFHQHF